MTTSRTYIGLACTGHENALALADAEGRVIFAEGTERYLQNKRGTGSPADDFFRIQKLVRRFIPAGSGTVIARNWSHRTPQVLQAEAGKLQREGSVGLWRKMQEQEAALFDMVIHSIPHSGRNLTGVLRSMFGKAPEDRGFVHHHCHAAHGFYASPFASATALVVDGLGEGTAVSSFSCDRSGVHELDSGGTAEEPLCSLGLFYMLVLCPLCGFSGWSGEEWKVMGLAACGTLDHELVENFRSLFTVRGVTLRWSERAPEVLNSLAKRGIRPGQPSIELADLARSGQEAFALVMTELLTNLHQVAPSDDLILVGGCALNSSYNGRIVNETPFRKLFVPSAPADDGTAIGAALLAFAEDHPGVRPPVVDTAYLGSCLDPETVDRVVSFGDGNQIERLPTEAMNRRVAELLDAGWIVGVARGEAEFGPRALGNRSILADPRNPGMKDRINLRVKFREEFRPFAPAILHEHGAAFFEDYQDSPYMERTLRFRESVKNRVPAVVHDDGTGRPQSVTFERNVPFAGLLTEFHRRTGVPIVLNTSFNIMGKPIIHSVEDALGLLYSTGLDAVVLEDLLVFKRQPPVVDVSRPVGRSVFP